jgi:hypothetical protein
MVNPDAGWADPLPRRQLPVVIICRDLVSDLRRLVGWLEAAGHERLVLVDNASTYPPLLDYLRGTPHEVVWLPVNAGQRSPWLSGLLDGLGSATPFAVSDPDVLPDDAAPADSLEHLQELLLRHTAFDKAGFGLHIDDLPARYPHRDAVRRWEAPFWEREVEAGVFAAHVDTTLAVYRPGTPYKVTESLRTGPPRLARHLPWYRDPRKPDAETAYYFAHRDPATGFWNRPNLPAAVRLRLAEEQPDS